MLHAQDAVGGLIRYEFKPDDKGIDWGIGTQFMVWNGEKKSDWNNALSLDYTLSLSRFDFNLGVAHIAETTTVNGTHVNFILGAAINLGDHFRVGYTHFSNAHNKNNQGWNFLGVSYVF